MKNKFYVFYMYLSKSLNLKGFQTFSNAISQFQIKPSELLLRILNFRSSYCLTSQKD